MRPCDSDLHSLGERPDLTGMEDDTELNSAFEWLRADPTHRAIQAPSELAALLDYYRIQLAYPQETFNRTQFLSPTQLFPSDTETRFVGYRGYTWM